MRTSLKLLGLIAVGAMCGCIAPATVPAQATYHPALLDAPDGMGEHPAQVIAMYLMRRNEITRTTPVVIFCGPIARQWVSAELARHLRVLQGGIQADSVVVVDDCPSSLQYGTWAQSATENRETVWVASMTFGRFQSEIVAFAKPYRHRGEPPYSPGRLERFTWDHRIVNAGTSLTFSDFQPPH